MGTERDAILRRRKELRSEFGDLYERVSAILFKEDPGGVNFEINPDEYESEVDLILPLGLTRFGGRFSYAAFFTECRSSNSIGLL